MAFTNEYSEALQANLPSQRFALAFAGLSGFHAHPHHPAWLVEKTPRPRKEKG